MQIGFKINTISNSYYNIMDIINPVERTSPTCTIRPIESHPLSILLLLLLLYYDNLFLGATASRLFCINSPRVLCICLYT